MKMKRLNKEQSKKFDDLYSTTLNWGNDENCIGLFCKLLDSDVEWESSNLYYLTTCMREDRNQIEVLDFDGWGYYDLVGYIPLNSKTKTMLKKVVCCLLSGGSFNDVRDLL